jgi:hypothetical protein
MSSFVKWLKWLSGGVSPAPACFVALSLVAACASIDEPAPEAGFATISGAASTLPWLYFDAPTNATLANYQPSADFQFHVTKGKALQVQAQASKTAVLTVALARWTGKAWATFKSASGKGSVILSTTPNLDGTYRFHVTSKPVAQVVTVTLTCGAGKGQCSGYGQPGDSCGGKGTKVCEGGLFCSFAPAAICGMADAQGTCNAKPQICPMIYMPVCGCDGKTYGNGCSAASAGTSVAKAGACCIDTPFSPASIGAPVVVGVWHELSGTGSEDWYTFHSDGTFQRDDAIAACPPGAKCFWSGIVTSQGAWKAAGSQVVLTWSQKAAQTKNPFPKMLQALKQCATWHLQDAANVYAKDDAGNP